MIAAGFGAPSRSSSSRKNSAVGALPMATTEPAIRSPHSLIAAAERVLPISLAMAAVRGSRSVQITSLAAGSLARVTPCATISASQKIGAPAAQGRPRRLDETLREHEMPRGLNLPAGVDHADGDIGLGLGEAGKVGLGRMMAKERS